MKLSFRCCSLQLKRGIRRGFGSRWFGLQRSGVGPLVASCSGCKSNAACENSSAEALDLIPLRQTVGALWCRTHFAPQFLKLTCIGGQEGTASRTALDVGFFMIPVVAPRIAPETCSLSEETMIRGESSIFETQTIMTWSECWMRSEQVACKLPGDTLMSDTWRDSSPGPQSDLLVPHISPFRSFRNKKGVHRKVCPVLLAQA